MQLLRETRETRATSKRRIKHKLAVTISVSVLFANLPEKIHGVIKRYVMIDSSLITVEGSLFGAKKTALEIIILNEKLKNEVSRDKPHVRIQKEAQANIIAKIESLSKTRYYTSCWQR